MNPWAIVAVLLAVLLVIGLAVAVVARWVVEGAPWLRREPEPETWGDNGRHPEWSDWPADTRRKVGDMPMTERDFGF